MLRKSGFFGALHTFLGRRRLCSSGSHLRERIRPRLEALEERTLLAVQLLSHYNGLDFDTSAGWTPPDTVGGAGPTSYVETVNATVAIFTPKDTGASAVRDSVYHFFFVTGGLLHASPNSDPADTSMVWDDQVQRFLVTDHDYDSNTGASHFDVAVSKSASPVTLTAADWNFYAFDTTEPGFFPDFEGNMGYNHDAFVWTFDMFDQNGNLDHAEINAVSIADLVAGVPSPAYVKSQLAGFNFSVRPTVMHDSVSGDPMWFVTDGVNNTTIRVVEEINLLTQPSFSVTTLTIANKLPPVLPLQPDGTTITTNLLPYITKAAEYNGMIVACQSVAASPNEDDARWYQIDVSSGTPVLADEGNVSAGSDTYIVYPAIDINADGFIGMTYMASGLYGPFMSVYATARLPSDPAGTMETPVLIQAGEANYQDYLPSVGRSQRAGDFSGISVDADGTFWIANEFANTEPLANWGTTIGHFTVSGATAARPRNRSFFWAARSGMVDDSVATWGTAGITGNQLAGGDTGNGLGGGLYAENGSTVMFKNAPILANLTDSGAGDDGGSQAGQGLGGGVSVTLRATVTADSFLVLGEVPPHQRR
jgi:hypothetical protein